jgi:putative SOS response-associated peptidase YedK
MCGRYYISVDKEEILQSYNISTVNIDGLQMGEVFPGTDVPVIIGAGVRSLQLLRWGFKLSGTKKDIINARIETVMEKPLFRRAFCERRCLVPASCFYEWQTNGTNKSKYEISLKNTALFSMAGLYDTFIDTNGNKYTAVVILTTKSNGQMAHIHDRMPVILSKSLEIKWLSDSNSDLDTIKSEIENNEGIEFTIKTADSAVQLSFYQTGLAD